MRIGVDVGRSAVKVYGDGVREVLPSGLVPGWPTRMAGEEADDILIEFEGERYVLSDDPGAVYELTERKVSTETALVLLAAVAVAASGTGEPDFWVTTGLPAAYAPVDARTLARRLQAIQEAAACRFIVRGREVAFRVRRIDFVREGDGLLHDYLSHAAQRPDQTVVVDIGHVTTNVNVYRGTRAVQVATLRTGGAEVYRRLAVELPLRDPRLHTLDESAVRRIVRAFERGQSPVVRGLDIDVPRTIREVAAAVWRQAILPQLDTYVVTARLADVVIVGGGGVCLFPVDLEGAHIPADPRMAQARGYHAIACRLAGSDVPAGVEAGP